MAVEQVKSYIKHGHLELEVPTGMTADEAKAHYAVNYPELEFAELKQGVLNGDKMVYEVQKETKVGTKG